MPRFPRPCPNCQILHMNNSEFCEKCSREKKRIKESDPARRIRKALLYGTTLYRKEREAIRNSATHCHLCGLAFVSKDEITADHLIAGDPTSPLAPAHKTCNSSRGNRGLPNGI